MALIRSTNGVFTGTQQADVFKDSDGSAVLKGLGGADRFLLGGGNDRANGGGGNDLFVFASDDQTGTFVGGNGADRYVIRDAFSGDISVQFNADEGDKLVVQRAGYAEDTNADGDRVLTWDDGSSVTLVGSGDGVPVDHGSMPPVPVALGKSWWVGTLGNDDVFGLAKANYWGKTGLDYINGNDGDNIIVTNSNNGTWDGTTASFPGGNSTYIDGGRGSDDIYVDASKGAFEIFTGISGADDVFVYGGDYVMINDMLDGATEADTFNFSKNFRGDGDRASIDAKIASFDPNDTLVLRGNWTLDEIGGGNTVYENVDTGALVQLQGYDAQPDDVQFLLA